MSAADAATVRHAARVIQRTSKRPKSWSLLVLVKILNNVADKLEAKDLVDDGPD